MASRDFATLLERTARPAMFLQRSMLPVPLDHPALSYFGGLPRLPPHLAWPTLEIEPLELDLDDVPDLEELEDASRALFFAAQIDLAELPPVAGNPLPRTGTLYFFFDANAESPDGDAARVLYYAGSARDLPEREPPPNLWPYGYGSEPWPWLEEDEAAGCIGFKHPIRFMPFDSYRGELENRGPTQALPDAELDARLPSKSRPSSYGELPGADWPFAWPLIAHLARAVCHAAAAQSTDHAPGSELATLLQDMTSRAEQWLEHARQHRELLCDAVTREWFREEWRCMQAAIERAGKQPHCSLSLGSVAARATLLTCFELASEADDGAELIPPALMHWLEAASMREPSERTAAAPPGSQMLGHGWTSKPTLPLHAVTREPASEVLLLQIAGDEGLGWFNSLGCVLQFWIEPETLAARDFERVTFSLNGD